MKADFYLLRNQVKRYQWGSPDWIPRFLGMSPDGEPWAELWMGSHPASPSMVSIKGRELGLGALISHDPLFFLGKTAAERYGSLPFLFKLLAAAKPLSIQAHPNLAQAREGFARENHAGIPLDAAERNYRDPNHKPEIICALTPFTGMCGFREPNEIRLLLGDFLLPLPQNAPLRMAFAPLLAELEAEGAGEPQAETLRCFFLALFALDKEIRKELTRYILSAAQTGSMTGGVEAGNNEGRQRLSPALWNLMLRFAELYPDDPALIAPLYLNLISLKPGEAVFLRAGILHSYVYGLGVELMANSDNVLRGGLSPKHIDVPELMRVLDFSPVKPEILRPLPAKNAAWAQPGSARLFYSSACDEFSLSVIHNDEGEILFSEAGPVICLVSEGKLEIAGGDGGSVLEAGESVFIPARGHGKKPLRFRGGFTLYAAASAKTNENSG